MRSLLNIPFKSTLPKLLTPRLYSTATSGRPQFISAFQIPTPHSNGSIRVLSLCRPEARNAINIQLLQELRAHVDDIAAEYDADGNEIEKVGVQAAEGPTRALIITSDVDGVFCAGADLKERATFTPEMTQTFLHNLRSTFAKLSNLPIPTISAISSVALGGGLELALSTHMRVLASTAVVGLPETRLGIIPGAGGTYRLPALIGVGRARDLILTGRRVSGPEAYFLGIADRLVEVKEDEGEGEAEQEAKGDVSKRAKEAVLREAVKLAGTICEGGPVATRSALKAVGWAREDGKEETCFQGEMRGRYCFNHSLKLE
ncbi:hypothetical protein EYC84_009214 [Monilinia fructicola]|uniref:Enoyl-CoA hydratase n=1 Tax=Monilinia fructicola TaxID=38448 RepID=A0A5M9JFF7_MONFR|nr:hypothetical protein EYC84_009214 [Monilinia fructicola]